MIHESAPWKAHLARDAELIERWAAKPRQSERRSFLIERKVFLAAYAMRKLDDATKLSTDTLGSPMAVYRFPRARAGYSEANSHRWEEFFDLGNATSVQLPRRRVLNLLIHSLVFIEGVGETGTFDAFMVTSDQEQGRGLVQVELATFVGLMRLAANDYPTAMRRTLDSATGRWRIWAGHGDPPPEVS